MIAAGCVCERGGGCGGGAVRDAVTGWSPGMSTPCRSPKEFL